MFFKQTRSLFAGLLLFILAACSPWPTLQELPTAAPTETAAPPSGTPTGTSTSSPTVKPTETATATSTATFTPSPTAEPTARPTGTPVPTPTETAAPTQGRPQATILMQANCRYGPATAYLYSHGLYKGNRAQVDGRNSSGTWLWIQPENLDRHCWAAASVMEVTGSIKGLPVVNTPLPVSVLYGPPQNVRATRQGDQVTVTWNPVWMTEDDDRGYLLEVYLCQKGAYFWTAVQTNTPGYTFTDDNTCTQASGGKLYTVEKHGYTDSVKIPWP